MARRSKQDQRPKILTEDVDPIPEWDGLTEAERFMARVEAESYKQRENDSAEEAEVKAYAMAEDLVDEIAGFARRSPECKDHWTDKYLTDGRTLTGQVGLEGRHPGLEHRFKFLSIGFDRLINYDSVETAEAKAYAMAEAMEW